MQSTIHLIRGDQDEEGLVLQEQRATLSTNLNKNVNVHFLDICKGTYSIRNLLVLVPVQILTILGIESMPRQTSY